MSDTGKDKKGRFVPGHKLAKGNPYIDKVMELKKAMYTSVTQADMKKVIDNLKTQAIAGEPWAVKELLDRCLGKPQQTIDTNITGGSVDPVQVTVAIAAILGIKC